MTVEYLTTEALDFLMTEDGDYLLLINQWHVDQYNNQLNSKEMFEIPLPVAPGMVEYQLRMPQISLSTYYGSSRAIA